MSLLGYKASIVAMCYGIFFSDLRWEKARVAYTKPQKRKKAKSYEEREIRSSLLILDMKDGKLYD